MDPLCRRLVPRGCSVSVTSIGIAIQTEQIVLNLVGVGVESAHFDGKSFAIRGLMSDIVKLSSDLAIKKLREKLIADTTLPEAVRTAFLADLETANPAALAGLKAALAREDQVDQTIGSQSS